MHQNGNFQALGPKNVKNLQTPQIIYPDMKEATYGLKFLNVLVMDKERLKCVTCCIGLKKKPGTGIRVLKVLAMGKEQLRCFTLVEIREQPCVKSLCKSKKNRWTHEFQC